MKLTKLTSALLVATMLSVTAVTSFAADTTSVAPIKTVVAPVKFIDGIKNSLLYILNFAVNRMMPTIELTEGNTISLAGIAASKATYTSSDINVAMVSSNGVITPVGNGSCCITVTGNNIICTFKVIVSGFAEEPVKQDPIFIESTAKNVLLDTKLLGFQMGDNMASVKKGIGDPDIQGKNYIVYNGPNFTAFGRFLENASYCFDEGGSLVMIDYVWDSAAVTSNAKKDLNAIYDMVKKSIIREYGNPEGVGAADGNKFAQWVFDKPVSGNIKSCVLEYYTDKDGKASLTLTLDGAVAGIGMDMPEPSLY